MVALYAYINKKRLKQVKFDQSFLIEHFNSINMKNKFTVCYNLLLLVYYCINIGKHVCCKMYIFVARSINIHLILHMFSYLCTMSASLPYILYIDLPLVRKLTWLRILIYNFQTCYLIMYFS